MAMEWLAPVVTGVIGLGGIAGTYAAAAAQRRFQIDSIKQQQRYDWAKTEAAKREEAYLTYAEALKETVVIVMGRARDKGDFKYTDRLDRETCVRRLADARLPRERAWERLSLQSESHVREAAKELYEWLAQMEDYARDEPGVQVPWNELWDGYEVRREAFRAAARSSIRVGSVA
ncbi:hypothetical protein ACQPZX_21940 [Actinoplanes sp. CA-142083]|uniref:hypothetical protein n=1 Tax=Actinoplanes sp. CA-142083 TaxID=3239903 RepID=UPI003D90E58D